MLTLEFVPYQTVAHLTPARRIDRLLKLVKEDKIVLFEGRLPKEEEAAMIRKTMESISSKFKGIEIGTIYPSTESDIFNKIRKTVVDILLGNRQGFTIIGPATVVKEIKQDPNKIQLFTENKKKR